LLELIDSQIKPDHPGNQIQVKLKTKKPIY